VTAYGASAANDTAIVTGEAVALDLRVARAGSRMLAFAIDATILFVGLIVAFTIVGHVLSGSDDALAAAVATALLVICFLVIPVGVETLTRGRSIGKLALGLRVVRDDGGPIRFRQAFVRGVVGVFELYLFFGVPALITSLASRQGKRVGDYLAGTIVLQERVPAKTAPPVLMPPQLAPWAATADLSGVSDSVALAARSYVGRAQQLRPEIRAQMEAQLAAALTAVVTPPPPAGTPGWAVIAAVLAERRRRDELRRRELPSPDVSAPPARPVPTTTTHAENPTQPTRPGGFAPPA
jgi:uncharacterized RDD family membrane protein YckC